MNRELLTKLYDKAISRCETADAWKFEEEFCKAVLEELPDLIDYSYDFMMGNIEQHFGVKLNATS